MLPSLSNLWRVMRKSRCDLLHVPQGVTLPWGALLRHFFVLSTRDDMPGRMSCRRGTSWHQPHINKCNLGPLEKASLFCSSKLYKRNDKSSPVRETRVKWFFLQLHWKSTPLDWTNVFEMAQETNEIRLSGKSLLS